MKTQTNSEDLKVWLIVATVLYSVISFFALLTLPFAAMAFDAPGSTSNPGPVLSVLGFVSFPFASLIAIIVSWATLKENTKVSLIFSLLPVLSVAILLAGMMMW